MCPIIDTNRKRVSSQAISLVWDMRSILPNPYSWIVLISLSSNIVRIMYKMQLPKCYLKYTPSILPLIEEKHGTCKQDEWRTSVKI